jgi:hypothetical protein
VEGGANLLLYLSVEVDEDVPTGDEVDARKWRILEKAVLGDQHRIAQFAGHTIMVAFPGKEAPQSLFRHVCFDGDRIAPLTGDGQSILIEIGSQHLQPAADLVTGRFFKQQNCDRISLFASGAAGNPDTNRVGNAFVIEQARDD